MSLLSTIHLYVTGAANLHRLRATIIAHNQAKPPLHTWYIRKYSFRWALTLAPLVLGYPNPPTCYTKVLQMAQEITQRAAEIKNAPETNGCVMSKMRSYISMVEGLRERRCAYTRPVRWLGVTTRQLYMIMSQRCHGELVFTTDNCAALERRQAGA